MTINDLQRHITHYASRVTILLFVLAVCVPRTVVAQSRSASEPGCELVVASALVAGNWEIVVLDTARRQVLNLSTTPEDEQHPAWSPDGRFLAFAAQRGGVWDVYTQELSTGAITRLTNTPWYEGFPSWSPDGTRLAFESTVEGDVDLYVRTMQSGVVDAVVTDAGADLEPQWLGDQLLYTTWRDGLRHLALFDLAANESRLLTAPHEEPMQAAVAPDGRSVAYVSMGNSQNELRLRSVQSAEANVLANTRHYAWPFWGVAGEKTQLHSLALAGGDSYSYPSGWRMQMHDLDGVIRQPLPAVSLPGSWQRPECAPAGAVRPVGAWQPVGQVLVAQLGRKPASRMALRPERGLSEVTDVDAPSALFASAVAPSFERLRTDVRAASGFDYLSVFGDTWRSIGNEHGELLSWHKTGRAFDVRHAYNVGGLRRLYVTRQVLGNQTYFRIYLLAKQQDGSQGAPLRDSVWEFIGRRGDPRVVREGGYALPPPPGYFVDFTDLAEREGWTRIPGLTPPDGDWRERYNDIEYWHYERRDGLRWYAAMQLLYSEERLREFITADALRDRNYTAQDIRRAGVRE